MALILGLDPSQNTGWALYDPSREISTIRCGIIKFTAEAGKFEQNASRLGRAFATFVKEQGRPDFAVIEQAPRQPAGQFKAKAQVKTVRFMGQEMPAQSGDDETSGGGGLQSTLSTNQMAAALASILGAYNVPFVTMTDSDWRKRAYGFGRQKGWARKEWKKHSRQQCMQQKIHVTNDDMAEACWIAFAGASSDEFKMLSMRAAA
ncbi:hypothetical protein [Pseudochrobactrum sp. MP213Fo]|uniref:hypothetical protein n=1 Tax=Pseudochrobactrum sp. MP213Fo TaxID=3022250 RepID=UPI003BA2EF65